MTFYYTVGYYNYDEGASLELSHKKKLTYEEFHDMITKATEDIITEKLTSNKYSMKINFSDILSEVADYLVKNNGFQRLDYTQSILMLNEDILDYNNKSVDDDLEKLKGKLGLYDDN